MAFHPATCPQCKGSLQIPDDRSAVKCMYCGVEIIVAEAISKNGAELGSLLTLAARASEARNFEEAGQLYSRVLEREPDNVKALLGKGEAAGWCSTLQNIRLNEMLTYFNAAISAAPKETKAQVRHLASNHLESVSAALWRMATDHVARFAALDDTWPEFVGRAKLFVQVDQIAHSYNPDDVLPLKNIVATCQHLLQGMRYTDFHGYIAYHSLDPASAKLFRDWMDRAVSDLRALDPSYQPPTIEVAQATGCLALIVFFLSSALALVAVALT